MGGLFCCPITPLLQLANGLLILAKLTAYVRKIFLRQIHCYEKIIYLPCHLFNDGICGPRTRQSCCFNKY